MIYASEHQSCRETVVVNINNRNPIALFGRYFESAAIDSEGAILYFSQNYGKDKSQLISPSFLPNGEKAVKFACGEKLIYALSSTGRVYLSLAKGNLEFNLVQKLADIEITDISGTTYHFLSLSKDGRVFAFGKNDRGEFGGGPMVVPESKILQISLFKNKNITNIYAGFSASYFQTSTGKILACGNNKYGQLFIKYNPEVDCCYFPLETEIKEGAQFIVAGDDLAFAFIDCDPTNSPNRKNGFPLERVEGPIKYDAIEKEIELTSKN